MATERVPWRAVLAGTATHTDQSLASLPQVAANLVDLGTALTAGPDPVIAPGSVEIVQDARRPHDILERIALQPPSERILFYFGGHGMDQEQRLYLALPDSRDEHRHRARTGLAIADVLEQLTIDPPHRRQAVVILDCCYAGLAAGEAEAADVHLLMAVGRAHKARYDVGGRNTLFTTALLRLLRGGIPNGPRLIDLDTVYEHLARDLRPADGGTLTPHQRTVNASGRIHLVRNPWHSIALNPQGLRKRARLAVEVGKSRPAQAAGLFAEIVRDAGTVPGVDPSDEFLYHAYEASHIGRAGDPDSAARALKDLLGGDLTGLREDDVAAARASLEYWTRRSSPG